MSIQKKTTVTLLAIIAIASFAYAWILVVKGREHNIDDPNNYPYKFSKVKESHFTRFVCDDVNCDGKSELFYLLDRAFEEIEPPVSMFYYSFDSDMHQIRKEYYFDSEFHPDFIDINADGLKEILASKRRNDSVFVEIRSLENDTIANFFALAKDEYTLKGNHLTWDCQIGFKDIVDLNNDGRKDIIGKVLTNRRASPRGLYAFDYGSGEIIWKYQTGALVHSADVSDINSDGINEYLLTTGCVRNLDSTVVINGTNDWSVYFIIVDSQGKEVFKQNLGDIQGARSHLFIGDINHDDLTDYVVVYDVRERISGEDNSKIYLYDPATNQLNKKIELARSFYFLALFDLNHDGAAELIFVDDHNNIGAYRYNEEINTFELYKETKIPFQIKWVVGNEFIVDIDNDGIMEILLNTLDHLFVLDNRFEIKAMHPNVNYRAIIHGGFGQTRLMVSGRNKTYFVKLERNNNYLLKVVPGKQTFLMLISGLSILGILFIVLNSKPFQNSQSSPFISEQLLTWGAMTQRLAHNIKNPLTAILFNLKRIQRMHKNDLPDKSDKYDPYFDAITSEIERLRYATNAFMKLTDSSRMNIQLADINELLKEVIERLGVESQLNGKLKLTLGVRLPNVRVDIELLNMALSNVLENSIEAISDNGEIIVSTSHIQKIIEKEKDIKDFVRIEILDTGGGIKDDDLSKVFNAGFSTKNNGSGYGLTITKQLITLHKGAIDIKSSEGLGTTVIIELPVG
jgi:nitrogen-specific signal transduction histidine kinase